jgi:hypothetical protein
MLVLSPNKKIIIKTKNNDNRFSVLPECMVPSTPASKCKDRTIMISWENPIINTSICKLWTQ